MGLLGVLASRESPLGRIRSDHAASAGWLAVLVVLCAGLVSCAASGRSGLEPIALASSESALEPRVGSRVHGWFALLESQPPAAVRSEDLLPEPSFELARADETLRDPGELRSWLSSLRTHNAQVQYQVGTIRLGSGGEDLVEARFEFTREALDETGTPHIARRGHTWLLRDLAGEPLRILRIEERPLLSFPGTGPQIVCY
jgi:hypothetical protein